MLINAVPLGFIDFAIAVINAKSSKRLNIWRSWQVFKITADLRLQRVM